jgi:hypothetical protein
MSGFVSLDGRTSILWGMNFPDRHPHWYRNFHLHRIPHDRVDHDDGNRKENQGIDELIVNLHLYIKL